MRRSSPPIAAALDLAAPVTITREKIVLGFETASFEEGRADESDAKAVLAVHAKAFFGHPTQVVFEVAARGSKLASVAYLDAAKKKAAIVEARNAVENHELVQKAIRIFDAELRDIKLPPEES